jgi:hypothetical protein
MKLLEYRNNWESDEYFVDGKPIRDIKKVSIDSKEYDVTARTVRVPYMDMGHRYDASSIHYFVNVKLGIEVPIDLNTIVNNTKVYATEYTV